MLKKSKSKRFFSFRSLLKIFMPFDASFHGGVAVSIDSQRIRMMELSSNKKGDKIFISSFSESALEHGVVSGDIILSPEELGREMYSCYQLGNFNSKNIFMNVSGNNVTIKKIDVPKGKELETMRFVENESRKHIPSQQEDVMIEYLIHHNEENAYDKADLIISKKDYIDLLKASVEQSGLNLVCVEPDFFSLFNSHALNIKEDSLRSNDETYYNNHIANAFIHIGLDKLTISVLNGSEISWGVSTSGGMLSFDRSIAEAENSPNLTYNDVKKIRLTKNVSLEYASEFSEFLSEIHSEILSFVNFYNSNHSNKKIEALYFTGELSGMSDVISKLSNKFMFVVKELNIEEFKRLQWESKNEDEDMSKRFILSNYDILGLALRGLDNVN